MKLRMKLTAGMLAATMLVSFMGFSTGSIQTEAAARGHGIETMGNHFTFSIILLAKKIIFTYTISERRYLYSFFLRQMMTSDGSDSSVK